MKKKMQTGVRAWGGCRIGTWVPRGERDSLDIVVSAKEGDP